MRKGEVMKVGNKKKSGPKGKKQYKDKMRQALQGGTKTLIRVSFKGKLGDRTKEILSKHLSNRSTEKTTVSDGTIDK